MECSPRSSQRFTLFHADGTPVRATLSCTFQQYREAELTLKALDLHSADVPKTLDRAARGHPQQHCRGGLPRSAACGVTIATANGLHNPRALTPGQILRLPNLAPCRRGSLKPWLSPCHGPRRPTDLADSSVRINGTVVPEAMRWSIEAMTVQQDVAGAGDVYATSGATGTRNACRCSGWTTRC